MPNRRKGLSLTLRKGSHLGIKRKDSALLRSWIPALVERSSTRIVLRTMTSTNIGPVMRGPTSSALRRLKRSASFVIAQSEMQAIPRRLRMTSYPVVSEDAPKSTTSPVSPASSLIIRLPKTLTLLSAPGTTAVNVGDLDSSWIKTSIRSTSVGPESVDSVLSSMGDSIVPPAYSPTVDYVRDLSSPE